MIKCNRCGKEEKYAVELTLQAQDTEPDTFDYNVLAYYSKIPRTYWICFECSNKLDKYIKRYFKCK